MTQITNRPNGPNVSGGFYTVAEAARLLGMDNGQRIVRWLTPRGTGDDAIVVRDYLKVGREHELSFLDLMEVRFVDHFRRQNISLQSLRVAARNAREELQISHPFAAESVKFQTDRQRVFLETAKETGDPRLLDLMTRNFVIYEAMERSLERSLTFDVCGLARLWRPAPDVAPNVMVSPAYAFGRPVVSRRHVPTATLFDAWKAEGGDEVAVSRWHEVTQDDVLEAVDFEMRPLH